MKQPADRPRGEIVNSEEPGARPPSAEGNSSAQTMPPSRWRNTQITANLAAEWVGDFRVPRHCRAPSIRRIAPPRNAGGPHAPSHSRAGADARGTRDASRREAHFFIGPAGGRTGIGAVHLQGLLERITQIVQQFFAALALRVDARNFLDPADPPVAVLLNDGGIARWHKSLREGWETRSSPKYTTPASRSTPGKIPCSPRPLPHFFASTVHAVRHLGCSKQPPDPAQQPGGATCGDFAPRKTKMAARSGATFWSLRFLHAS